MPSIGKETGKGGRGPTYLNVPSRNIPPPVSRVQLWVVYICRAWIQDLRGFGIHASRALRGFRIWPALRLIRVTIDSRFYTNSGQFYLLNTGQRYG